MGRNPVKVALVKNLKLRLKQLDQTIAQGERHHASLVAEQANLRRLLARHESPAVQEGGS